MSEGLRKANSPGKFEGELKITEYLWRGSEEGWNADELGDAETFGWYGLIKLGPDAVADLEKIMDEGDSLTPEERRFIARSKGVILSTDSSGFVYAEYYASKKKMDSDWKKLERAYEKFNEGEP